MLELDDLHCSYGPIDAVRGVSLEAAPGSLVCILGPNGAGKSTTLKAISGLVKPWRGSIRLAGEDVTRLDAARRLAKGIALCPEGRRILGDFTVEENLRLGAHLLGRRRCEARTHEAFETFPLLAERRRQLAGSLSGGQQQLLALARALMTAPKLLLLDEPSLGLSPLATRDVFRAVKRIRAQGTTVVLVEQKSVVLKDADYGYVLRNGRLDLEGPAPALIADERLKHVYLGA
jgi:branched-chain amino acid transport system ATP-binding protein